MYGLLQRKKNFFFKKNLHNQKKKPTFVPYFVFLDYFNTKYE